MKKALPTNVYGRPPITMPLIRRLARQIAEKFRPNKIILFGSYAYGEPGPDSDVDIMVVMRAANETTQAIRILRGIEHLFPMDLIVRTPKNLRWRLKEGDWFLREIVEKGKVLYEKTNPRMGGKGRRGHGRGTPVGKRKAGA